MFPGAQTCFQGRQKAFGTVQIEIHFRNQYEIDILLGKDHGRCDKSGIPAHQFDQSDPVGISFGLAVRRLDGKGGDVHGRIESKRTGHQINVIVDGLGDANDTDLQAPFGDAVCDFGRGFQSSVSADHEQHPDILTFEAVDDFIDGLGSPG